MDLLNVKTGKIESIPNEQVQQAVASGQYALKKGITLPVISPDGTPGTIQSEEASKAFQSGFMLETPEQTATRQEREKLSDMPVTAAALGAARGLSFGASDVLATDILGVKPETIRTIEEENPVSSLAGEAAGVIAPAVLSGGTSVLARGAQISGKAVLGATKAGLAVEKATTKLLAQTLKDQGQRTLAKKVLEKTAPKIVGSAVEGAFYGAGHIVSEDALGRADLNAESLIANVGLGALIGGTAGGIFGTVGLAQDAATRAVMKSGKAAKSLWEKVSGKAVVKETTKEGTEVTEKGLLDYLDPEFIKAKANLPELKAAADRLDVRLTAAQESESWFQHKAEGYLRDSTSAFGQIVREETNAVHKGLQRNADTIFENASEKTEYQVGSEVRAQLIKEVQDKLDPISKMYDEIRNVRGSVEVAEKAVSKTARRLEEIGSTIGAKGSPFEQQSQYWAARLKQQSTVDDLAKLTREVGSNFEKQLTREENRFFSQIYGELKDLQDKQIMAEAIRLRSAGAPNSGQAAREVIKLRKTADKEFSELMGLLSDIGKEAKLGKVSSAASLETKLMGLSPELVAQKLFNTKNVKSLQFFAEKFPKQFEELKKLQKAKILSKSIKDHEMFGEYINIPALTKQIDNLSPEVRNLIFTSDELATIADIKLVNSTLPKPTNPSGTDIRSDFKRLFDPIFHLTDMGIYQIYKGLGKGIKTPEAMMVQKVDDLATVERSVNKVTNTIKKSIDRFMKGTKKTIDATKPAITSTILSTSYSSDKKLRKSEAETKTTAFLKRRNEISEYAANPQKFIEVMARRTARLQDAAPNTAGIISQKATVAIEFLYSKLPQNPAAGRSSNLMIRDWKPSTVQIAKFDRYMKAVNNPLTVLEELESGVLNREGVEAVKIVYPEIYNEMVKEVTNSVAELRENLPYKKRLLLSTLLDVPIDLAQQPEFLNALQSRYLPEEEQQSAVPTTVGGLKGINLADKTMTETQRISNRA